ncbi:Wall-associated receptor kinase [Quillaja saponaria]|uniref:Wall-associated receptor kinase n=1 Tax=Quillaja saponaria TaxID=32244 RepID=A0AAD7PSK9_QUISA|nr:Wall-associated receptor kinase [Quillaja saponaria]
MRRKLLLLSLLGLFVFQFITPVHANPSCYQTCGKKQSAKHYPYPFGFSSGCQIRLNCTPNHQIFIGDFPVKSIDSDSITISIQAQCNRPLLHSLRQLFAYNYAPTSRNAILLQNCTAPVSPCIIPAMNVLTHFESPDCNSSSGNLSCYAETPGSAFVSFDKLAQSRCHHLVSSISANGSLNGSATSPGVSLEVGVAELGYWLDGDCRQCCKEANCTKILSPTDGTPKYRCRCKEDFVGDGYLAGSGCRKASCSPAKYISGKCGGTTRIVVLIAGIIAGASLMTCLVLVCCYIHRRHSKLKARKSTKLRISQATGSCSIPIYPYKEIERATNSFSEKQRLGTGAYGTVYAGKLHNDKWVAIKRIKHRDTDSIEQVMNEIKLLCSVSHPNLVRLLGCSIEYGDQILVYEFMPNGTLCQHLQRERGDGVPWPIRLTIATETAQAIAHLHSAINPPIYHRDIKSSNILLDYNFRSKVADFGLSRIGMTEISYISTAPQGTPGYLDPQYHQDFHLSDKSDVYSFGVVLVEIITGLKVVDFSRPQNEVNLASLATDRIGKGCLDEIIDPFLEPQGDPWTISSMHKVAELAFRCLAFHRDMRPSMMEVATELENISLSEWTCSYEENNCTASSGLSSGSCSSSNESEKPLNAAPSKAGIEDLKGPLSPKTHTSILISNGRSKDDSQVSVQDEWLREQSSPSSNSLPRKAVQ